MKQLLTILLVLGSFTTAQAAKNCTNEKDKKKWMKVEDFKKKVQEMGYTIRKFKTPGNCYEIYGTDKDGKNVEIYFNPVDASIVEKE